MGHSGRAEESRRTTRPGRADLLDVLVVAAVCVGVAVAVVVGRVRIGSGDPIHADAAPFTALWQLHRGVGTLLAPLLAVVVVTWGVRWARTASWRVLWPVTWLITAGWLLAVAWVEPWKRGVLDPLLSRFDYLAAVDRVTDVSVLTSGFVTSIPSDATEPWPTHVASHPPGALAPFVVLDHVGLGGPGPAAALIVTVAASTSVALLVAAKALLGLDASRRLAPFVALAPGAMWIAVSADALFMACVAWAVALMSVAVVTGTGRAAIGLSVASGAVLGSSFYLSYGMVLASLIVVAVLACRRAWRLLVPLTAGVLAVVAVVTAAGFWWLEGYQLVVQRYADGLGGQRPYSYWVWANLAAFAVAVGPAAVVGVRRALSDRVVPAALLSSAAVACVTLATVGGLSKAEVERIWLPFGAWVLFAAVAIPAQRARLWLGAQAVVVIITAHVLLTPW